MGRLVVMKDLFYAICAFFGLRKVTTHYVDDYGWEEVSKWVWAPTWDRYSMHAHKSGIVGENQAYSISGWRFDNFLKRGMKLHGGTSRVRRIRRPN